MNLAGKRTVEVGKQKTENSGQKTVDGEWRMEVKSQKSKVREQRTESGGQKSEVSGLRMMEGKSQKSKVRERRTESGGQKSEDSGLRMMEGKSQKSKVSEQRTEVRMRGMKFFAGSIVGIWVLVFGISLSGCVSEPSRTYKKEFMITYAELTLLYEQQKMEKKETDSAYQVTVRQFFEQKGLKQEDFKKAAEELSQNPQVWKLFIGDVATAVDSLKNLK